MISDYSESFPRLIVRDTDQIATMRGALKTYGAMKAMSSSRDERMIPIVARSIQLHLQSYPAVSRRTIEHALYSLDPVYCKSSTMGFIANKIKLPKGVEEERLTLLLTDFAKATGLSENGNRMALKLVPGTKHPCELSRFVYYKPSAMRDYLKKLGISEERVDDVVRVKVPVSILQL